MSGSRHRSSVWKPEKDNGTAGNMPEVSWNKEKMRDEAGTDHAGSGKQQTVWE